MLNKRTNIMFDEDLWKKLTQLAKRQQVSVGEIVRVAAQEKVEEEQVLLQRQKAITATLQKRILLKEKIDYKELINYGRKY